MPDLNLIDENELDESSPQPEQAPPARSGGRVSYRTHIIVLLVLSGILGGGYFMWKQGIFPFKKKQAPVVSQVQDDFSQEQYQQQYAEQTPAEQPMNPDSADVALLETPLPEEGTSAVKKEESSAGTEPAVEEKSSEPKKEEAKPVRKGSAKPDAAVDETAMTGSGSQKLADMKGGFTVQVVSYREKKTAADMAKHLSVNSGYPAFVQKSRMKGGDWWSVCIGRYTSKQDAAKAVPAFGEQLRIVSIITRVTE